MVDNAVANDPLDQLDAPEPDVSVPNPEQSDGRELPINMDPRAELGALAKAAEPAEPAAEPATEPAQSAPQPTAQPATPQPPAAEQDNQPSATTVPLPSLLDEREKRQSAEHRAQALEQQMQQVNQQLLQLQQQPQNPVDPVTDPQGFVDSMNNAMRQQHMAMEQQMENNRLNQSEYMARNGPDAEHVDAAFQSFTVARQQNPALGEMVMRSPHPWQEMVNWHKQQQVQATIGNDLDAYNAKIEAEVLAKYGLQPPAATPTPPAQNPSAPITGASSNPQPVQQAQPPAAPTAPRIPQSLASAPGGLATPAVQFDAEADPLNSLD